MEQHSERALVLSEEVKLELEQVYFYYASDYSFESAEKLRIGFNLKVLTILPNPYIYPECRLFPTKTQMYRNIIWGNYLIVYRIKKNTVEVLSLFHTKQRPSKVKKISKRRG